MPPLSKKILLFLFLLSAFSFQLSAPSPSLAQNISNPHGYQYPCIAPNDCSPYPKQYNFTRCVCDPTELDTNQKCTNTQNDWLGKCATTECQTNDDCKGGLTTCVNNICVFPTQKNQDVADATPYFIRKPEDIIAAANDIDGPYDSDKFKIETMTGLASTMIVALGGGGESTEGDVEGAKTDGATGILTGLVLNMTTKPIISSKEYLADLGQNLGIIPISPAYAQAQGIGFNAFSPILPLWKIFRDIAYLAMVAIFIVVGLMVMFRKKIDPRTVVTIQEALPKIVVTLILITFSYAIAGLVVDIGDFATRLIGVTLGRNKLIAVEGGEFQNNILDQILKANVIDLTNQLRIPSKLAKAIATQKILPGNEPLPGPIAWLAEGTIWLALEIAGFFIMFKIFFALLAPYVSIILAVIFAPISLLLGAIPGSQYSVTSWLKGLIASVAVFPVTFTLLAIAAILKGTNEASLFGGMDWHVTPPPGGNYGLLWAPATIGAFGDLAGMLVAFGILFAVPKVAEQIQQSLGEKPGVLSQAAGEGITGAIAGAPVVGGLLGGFLKK